MVLGERTGVNKKQIAGGEQDFLSVLRVGNEYWTDRCRKSDAPHAHIDAHTRRHQVTTASEPNRVE